MLHASLVALGGCGLQPLRATGRGRFIWPYGARVQHRPLQPPLQVVNLLRPRQIVVQPGTSRPSCPDDGLHLFLRRHVLLLLASAVGW